MTTKAQGQGGQLKNLSKVWKGIFSGMKASWQPILLTHLAFTAIGVVIFAPLIGLSGRLLLKLSGQVALADQDIAHFLLSPLGMIALILFSSLLITILVFEQAVLMQLAGATIQGQKPGVFDVLRRTSLLVHNLWLFAARLVIRLLTLALPILAIAVTIAWLLISDYDINYYLSKRPPEFWTAAIGIGLLLLALAALLVRKLIHWSLSLPLVLFTRTSPAQSFELSRQQLSGKNGHVLLALVSWAALSLLSGICILGAIRLLGHWVIPAISGSLNLTILAVGALVALLSLLNILRTAFVSGTLAYLLVEIYRDHEGALSKLNSIDASVRQTPGFILRFQPKSLTTIILIGVIVAGIVGIRLVNSIPVNNETSIIAHRGAAGKAPENTLASIQQAIDDQADWVEIDVQENADGEIVVIHDSDFMKLAGNPLKIWDATEMQLQEIDIGSWYSPAFSEQRVPTLQQVLDIVRGKARLVIELKYYGHDVDLEQRVIDIVEQAGMADQIAIMSLKYDAVQKVRQLRPDWNVGLLSATAIGDLSKLDTDFLAVAMGMANTSFVERAQRAGRQVFVWTVNDPVSMSRMISRDVDGIITDEPALARRVLAERSSMSTIQLLLLDMALLLGDPKAPGEYRDNSP